MIIFGVVFVLFSFPFLSSNFNYKIVSIDFNKEVNTSSTPSVDWYYTWGGSGDDEGEGITVDSSDNIYIVGSTESFGASNKDICFMKFNPIGSVVWNYTWGELHSDRGFDIAVDDSGDLYIAGKTYNFGAGYGDMCLVKFNSTGGFEWYHTWGGGDGDGGYGIALDAAGNAYVCGSTHSFGAYNGDICLVKFNSTGVEWNYTWGGAGMDIGYGVALDAAGNAYVVGETDSFGAGYTDVCLIKFNSTGVVWNYTWGGGYYDWGYGVDVDVAGNAYVTGRTYTDSVGGTDVCLIKFNDAGVVDYYTWGGSEWEGGYDIVLDAEDNAYIVGDTNSFGAKFYDIILVKFNPMGTVEWYYMWGGDGWDTGYGVALDSMGNPYVVGYTERFRGGDYEICLLKFVEITPDGSQGPDPLLFLILGGIIGGVAGGSGIVAIWVLGIVRPRRKRARAVHAN
ncbi:MAG: SBBP repeat-containing protein [Promethearchaeota archaeon]